MDYKRVLLLRFTNGMSRREIAETTDDGKTTINDFLKRFRECEALTYPLSEDVTNEFIAGLLYQKAGNVTVSQKQVNLTSCLRSAGKHAAKTIVACMWTIATYWMSRLFSANVKICRNTEKS